MEKFEGAKRDFVAASQAPAAARGRGRFASIVTQQQATTKLAQRHDKAEANVHIAQPLLLCAKVWTAVQQTIWQMMAMAIMLVGVGVKLSIYDPIAKVDTHFALPLRMMIGISVMLVFALQLLYSMVIRRRQLYHMSPLKLLRTQTAHCILVGMQLIALIAQALFGLIPLIPAHMIFGQAILGLIQCILLHLHEHKIKVTGTALHPLAAVPDALEALRLKSLKKRLLEQHQMNIASIAKIQSLGRKKLARQRSSLMRTTKAMS